MIIFLFGQDNFRSARKLWQIREKFHKDVDPSGTNVHVFDVDAMDISLEDIHGAIGSLGFFSSKRLVIIKNIFSKKTLSREMTEYLCANTPLENVILVFWEPNEPDKRVGLFRRLIKEKYSQNFPLLKGNALINWILDEVKSRGASMEKKLAILLAQIFPEDMWQLSNEIDKLVAFADGRKITQELVKDFDHAVLNANIFDFVDCLSARDNKRLARLFKNIIDAENELYVLTMIHRQFRLLYQTKRLKENLNTPQELAKKIDVHPFVAKKLWQQVDNISLRKIQRSIDHLVRAELDIKTGRATPALALEIVLFGYA